MRRQCAHLWLPANGLIYRQVCCPRCGETRRVAKRWKRPEPRNISEALDEAERAGLIRPDENRWRRRRRGYQ